jgi:pimeloyl-ACP methyl ester carboxylesterase
VNPPFSLREIVPLTGILASALLGLGLLVRLLLAEPATVEPPVQTIELSDGTRLAYIKQGSGPPMVAIHGSPGSKADFSGLAPELSGEYQIYSFDMPGFGESSDWVANYGYVAAADYLAEAIRLLGLDPVIITGFSWGGGVALAFAANHPDLTATLLLINAVGVPEGFHTGRYWTEVVRYLAAAPVLFIYPGPLAGGSIPFSERFGFWRGFLDGDTREIRALAPSVTDPAVIVHGASDTVVGVESARAHHQLIPRSTLYLYDGGHGWIYREFGPLASAIREAMSESRR